MENIEIRRKKNFIILGILVLAIALIINIYLLFFQDKRFEDWTVKIIYYFVIFSISYSIYRLCLQLIDNEPVITINTNSLTIKNNKSSQVFYWKEIKSIIVETKPEEGYYLKVISQDKILETNINWLDKNPEQIKMLINDIGKPSFNGLSHNWTL